MDMVSSALFMETTSKNSHPGLTTYLTYGCDGLSTNIYRLHRLKEYFARLSIQLVVRETREKLLCQIEDELQENGMAHWREGRDKFHYGRFASANVISRWDRGDDDLWLHKTGAHQTKSKLTATGFDMERSRPKPLSKTGAKPL